MIARLFGRRQDVPAPGERSTDGMRLYAIGDIHGRLDLLEDILAQIRADNARRPPAPAQLIFLGDLIDRGPHSAQVVEAARQIAADGNVRFLLGNHEEVFLKAVEGDLKTLAFFTRIGGRETILSYGVTPDEYEASGFEELLELLRQRVPTEHLDFVSGFEDLIVVGDYAFVHAGIRPREPLARQRGSDLRWIREEFLSYSKPFEKIIVHGHTISADAEVGPWRIGLDTGAYRSGKLTAMGFEGAERWLLQTGG